MKKIILLFGLLILVGLGIAFAQKYPVETLFKQTTAVVNNSTFKLILAKSQKEKEVGLSEKKSLEQNAGMLFVFEKPDFYSFWMKNMKFPIDIIFIKDNKIITVYQNAKPPINNENNSLTIYKPEEPVDKVLEINSGLSEKNNIKKGDEIKFQNL